jgi:hypothetical protein
MVHCQFLITDLEDLREGGDHGVGHLQRLIHMLRRADVRPDGAWVEHQILMPRTGKHPHGMPPREHLIHMRMVERPQPGTRLPGRRILTLQTAERPRLGMHLLGRPIRTHPEGGLLRGRMLAQAQVGLPPVQPLKTITDGEIPVLRTIAERPEQAVGALPLALVGEREAILGYLTYVLIKFPNDLV